MAHDHDHSAHEGYYLDQLSTIAACGLLGGIAFLIWKTSLLLKFNILTGTFNLFVLLGGVLLIAVTVLRAVSLWSTVGKKKAMAHDHNHDHHHDHDQAPGEQCDHDHAHEHGHHHHHEHSHDHEHGHDHAHGHTHVHAHDDHAHGFAPWRYAVLLLPMMLSGLLIYYFFEGLELQYSADWLIRMQGKEIAITDGPEANEKAGAIPLGFAELNEVAMARDPSRREYFSGRVGELRGLFNPVSESQFTLFRLKMTCCASDAVPLKIRIISPASLVNRGLQPGKGVSVRGKIEFQKVVDREQWVPVMRLKDANDVRAEDIGNDIYDKGS